MTCSCLCDPGWVRAAIYYTSGVQNRWDDSIHTTHTHEHGHATSPGISRNKRDVVTYHGCQNLGRGAPTFEGSTGQTSERCSKRTSQDNTHPAIGKTCLPFLNSLSVALAVPSRWRQKLHIVWGVAIICNNNTNFYGICFFRLLFYRQ